MAPTHRRTAGVSTSSFIGRTCLQTKLADQKFMRLATATERAQSPVRAPTDIHPLSGRLQISGLLPTVPVGQRTVRQKYRNRLATKQIPPCNSGPRTASSFLFFLFFSPSDDDDWSVAAVLLCDQVPKVCKSPLYWLFLLIMQQYGGNLRSAANSSDAHSRPHCDSAHSGGRKRKEKTSADKDGESGRPIISSRVWERRKHNQLK